MSWQYLFLLSSRLLILVPLLICPCWSDTWCTLNCHGFKTQISKMLFTLWLPQNPRNQRNGSYIALWPGPVFPAYFPSPARFAPWSPQMSWTFQPVGFCSHHLLYANSHPCKSLPRKPDFILQIPVQVPLLSGLHSFPYQNERLHSIASS